MDTPHAVGAAAPALARRPRSARLHRGSDIRAVLRRGHAAHGRYLSVHALRREPPSPDGQTGRGGDSAPVTRTAVIVGRKLGGAVHRNRAKRRLRAALQQITLPAGHDLVLIARPRMRSLTHEELQVAVAEQVRRAVRIGAGPPR